MRKLEVPDRFNYVGCFISMKCGLDCSYCINAFSKPFSRNYKEMSAKKWIKAINRLELPEGLVPTIQGGEPSIRRDLNNIIKGLRKDIRLDILTNLQFDIDKFIKEIPPERFRQFNDVKGSFASIRASYHPEQMDLEDTVQRAKVLKDNGYAVGISIVNHPTAFSDVLDCKTHCEKVNVPFWSKEFLGFYNGKLYGTYKYPEAIRDKRKNVECRISELLIAPDGNIYRCHRDLYHQENQIGHILDRKFEIEDIFRPCDKFGECNPCDIKEKTNRHLKTGYTSVEIRGEK